MQQANVLTTGVCNYGRFAVELICGVEAEGRAVQRITWLQNQDVVLTGTRVCHQWHPPWLHCR